MSKPTNQELIDHVESLVAKCAELTSERDEARRLALEFEAAYNGMMFDNPKYSDPIAIMRERGWDCFKEEPTREVEEPPRYDNLQDLG